MVDLNINIIAVTGLIGVFLGMGLLYLSIRLISMVTGWMSERVSK